MPKIDINTLPKEINILGKVFTMEYVNRRYDVDDDYDAIGKILYQRGIIKIQVGEDMSIETIWQTIFHEIMHGTEKACKHDIFDTHEKLDLFANILFDTLNRSGLLAVHVGNENPNA